MQACFLEQLSIGTSHVQDYLLLFVDGDGWEMPSLQVVSVPSVKLQWGKNFYDQSKLWFKRSDLLYEQL